ncbi:MAG: peptidylprolyl isomerase [Acidobacteriota bacterium]
MRPRFSQFRARQLRGKPCWIALFFLLCPGAVEAEKEPVTAGRQVVLETGLGAIVLELFPKDAPRHVESFLERVRSGFYVGTTFHRAIPLGIIQGGDPLSRDTRERERYGTGGLFELKNEFNTVSHKAGTVSAVLAPGNPDSAGSQFFICVTDQKQLDGKYTAFGRVVEGLEVVEKISRLPTDSQQRLLQRVEVIRAYERDRPPAEDLPFADATPEEMARYHVLVKTNLGDMEIAFFPQAAPRHVRRFLRFARLGLYDGTTFHRVVPNFVIQGGLIRRRKPPIPSKFRRLLKPLEAEFNNHKHDRGAVSMARGKDPDSGLDTFFICLSRLESLDGNYTIFGHVVRGLEVVDGIAQVPLRGEAPLVPVTIQAIKVLEREE